ncbi:DsbE family thiol:disulfide interchange protein [Xanthomonas vesicatoria]|uniref:DsbE family thiol:disulfide interchange protein n=1 Tax=Xanthomonas vesicatoria TaxID=56460 RepID=UPI0007322040|nr:DsbE family thiol:disulfide interchange protein [Xanthomonas vesicatoria]KTF36845.1 thiol:disulfide interchange protein [Xanthomonas vesicatoria]MCC8560458.1 DsbE family thiol:disulfide interchange protein [Xanthomonas vesicatoria]MCC8603008.1 DsbE family thiol:disulfide interchange protein [Xanthomonas vesicatoria]MCC8611372.1 DsbE family thiol:disulfide interchange protein [Xanthomonas vesicatoria]MCC8674963.1 DsbE family thiol:disulfide interchange protein [Xanthomonas vesicatoria]
MKRMLPLLGFLLVAALFGFGIYWTMQHNPRDVPSPLIGKPAPAFSLPRLDAPDQHVTRAQLLGKPYVLNVFGSWCAECVHEHPVLMAQANRLGVPLIGYNYKDAPADATAWLARLGNPYAVVIADEDGQTAIDFGVYGAPESFLIDAQGVIRYKHIGVLTPDVINAELLPAIAALSEGAQ